MVVPAFATYVVAFGKVYNGDEIVIREAICNQAVTEMEARNANDSETCTHGVNEFSDMTLEEFQALKINREAIYNQAVTKMDTHTTHMRGRRSGRRKAAN